MNDLKEISSLLNSPNPEDVALIKKAYDFSKKAHEGQTRYSGEPYFIHVFATAKTLAELGMGPITISTGFLHDVLEDTSVTEEDLLKEFGKEITFMVKGVTKLGYVRYRGTDRYNESLRKLFVAVSQDIRVLIVKLADRLHNIQTLEHVPEEKRLRIASETLEIYAPVAYRLGIRKLSRELEDSAFPYVYPEEYKMIKDLFKEKSKESLLRLKKFSKSVQKALANQHISNFHTDFRIKGFYSLYNKWLRKGKDIERIFDIAALKIIVPSVNDCYQVLGVIHSIWRPLPGRIKDYIAFPKPNGYQSLHTTLFIGNGSLVEVQIKTEKMQKESEYGITSHISYKGKTQVKSSAGSSSIFGFGWIRALLPKKSEDHQEVAPSTKLTAQEKWDGIPAWIKELVHYQQEYKGSNETEELRTDFFEHRIFVFTPDGDVIDLPIDSSPIDFAYTIHSNIGDHVAGAKVNGKMVSLDTPLENGDRIEIITKTGSHPTSKWLNFVKTAVAKKHIRIALQKKELK